MSLLKLKRFPATAHTRLGDLIRKDRSPHGLTETEAAELLKLLRAATKTSEANAQLLHALRDFAPTIRQQSARQRPPRVPFALNFKKQMVPSAK